MGVSAAGLGPLAEHCFVFILFGPLDFETMQVIGCDLFLYNVIDEFFVL